MAFVLSWGKAWENCVPELSEMCEHSFRNPAYVGHMLNYSNADLLPFSNWPTGAHPSGLAQLYGRREVCSFQWTSPSTCLSPPQSIAFTGYTYPSNTNLVSVAGHSKGDSCNYVQNTNLRAELPDNQTALLTDEHGIRATASLNKCDFSDLDKGLQNTLTQTDSNSNSNAINKATVQLKQSTVQELSSSSKNTSAAFKDEFPWCSPQIRARKKRKLYTKPQLADLENEFRISEFINRQKRKELSERLDLSDKQVKIWFQNRRMKRKRLLMRERTFSVH